MSRFRKFLCSIYLHHWCSADFVVTGVVSGAKTFERGYIPQACLYCGKTRELHGCLREVE